MQLAKLRWRLDALDDARAELEARVAVMESRVNDLRFSDAVADALAQKLATKRKLELTLVQKIGAAAFAIALVLLPVLLQKVIG